ncbi:MAG: hypothetical protein GEV11_08760 [Streptosporangiales bacterium]|nr:hypothetical protein [Streptosporangiales bacterium]
MTEHRETGRPGSGGGSEPPPGNPLIPDDGEDARAGWAQTAVQPPPGNTVERLPVTIFFSVASALLADIVAQQVPVPWSALLVAMAAIVGAVGGRMLERVIAADFSSATARGIAAVRSGFERLQPLWRMMGPIDDAVLKLAKFLIRPTVAGLTAAVVLAVLIAPKITAMVSPEPECAPPKELPVLISPELAGQIRTAAAGFEDEQAASSGCRRVHVTVYTEEKLQSVIRALRVGWRSDTAGDRLSSAFNTIGPRPVLWIPSSMADVQQVPRSSGEPMPELRPLGPTVWSPLVLGVPENRAKDLDLAHRDSMNWTQALAALRRERIRLVRPNPDSSAAGLLHTTAVHEALNGGGADASRARVEFRRFEHAVGRSPSSDHELLCALRDGRLPRDETAVMVSEESLIAYNAGQSLGEPCGGAPGGLAADPKLLAYYPESGYGLDYPVVQVNWPGFGDDQTQGFVGRLYQYLARNVGGPLIGSGLRDAHGGHGQRYPPGGEPPTMYWAGNEPARPKPESVRRTLDEVGQTRDATRMLLTVDTSDGMDAEASPGLTRLDVAAVAAEGAAGYLGDGDTLGMWTVPGTDGRPYTDAVRPKKLEGDRGLDQLDLIRQELREPRRGARQSVNQAIEAGVEDLGRQRTPGTTALVVFTSGDPAPDREGLLRVRAAMDANPDVRVFVIAPGRDACKAEGIDGLARAAEVTCHDGDLVDVEDTVRGVFEDLWKVTTP